MVEGCPLVVDHHADYSTTQRERFIQENLGKFLVNPKSARGLIGLVTSWPCAVGLRISSIPGFLFTSSLSNFQKCYEHKQYKNGLKFAKQILSNPKFSEHGGKCGSVYFSCAKISIHFVRDVVPKRQVTDRAISIVFLVKHSGGLNSDACI